MKDKLLNIFIFILIIIFFILLLYKAGVIKKENKILDWEKLISIEFLDMEGNKIKARTFLENKENYILVFNITDCSLCITKGIEELKYFEKKGKNSFGIIIYDRPEEIKGWSSNYSFNRFYIITKEKYYKIFMNKYTPVLIYLYKNRVKWYKYITP